MSIGFSLSESFFFKMISKNTFIRKKGITKAGAGKLLLHLLALHIGITVK